MESIEINVSQEARVDIAENQKIIKAIAERLTYYQEKLDGVDDQDDRAFMCVAYAWSQFVEDLQLVQKLMDRDGRIKFIQRMMKDFQDKGFVIEREREDGKTNG
jgi:hypothetical protein